MRERKASILPLPEVLSSAHLIDPTEVHVGAAPHAVVRAGGADGAAQAGSFLVLCRLSVAQKTKGASFPRPRQKAKQHPGDHSFW